VRVHTSDLLQLILKLTYQIIFSILNLLNWFCYCAYSPSIYMCCLQDFIQLQVLYLQFFWNCVDFLFKNQILQSLFLLNGINCIVENLKQFFSFLFFIFEWLHFYFILILKVSIFSLLLIYISFYFGLLFNYFLLLK
jgi:hypothetical protein